MENITLGDISATIAFIAAFITSGGVIVGLVAKWATKWLLSALKPIETHMDELEKTITALDATVCKNFLMDYMASVQAGIEYDEASKKHFFDIYDHYTNDLHLNTYVHARYEELKEAGKLDR